MYAEEYHKMGVHPAVLSSSLESAGTVTSALIPWNTCGVFIKDTLNIAPWGAGGYGPWAIFNWLMPIINWSLPKGIKNHDNESESISLCGIRSR